ncbi:serine protease [Klebsiella pneumoniae]|uniref:S1 family peptidase n=1 Tax=Klebsiella pneumoniae TaxID=573 RepID=UPI00190B58D8|nr:serine protease [Klebsiella pneumoniae]EJL9104057.1 trypsin-like peptidase domain-containing protein [Klebsiella pneumoniae]EKU4422812.1 trypsin-like peptidase domain-containing protein [Klebsiella pneumoniae]EKW3488573.1 trypsin-like peptidase domain-containing protein [Klebsiella pneumoniae]ELB4137336.1 trypsin-like peptidase domain-containing protein [Klebsiella pneumoniae]ELB5408091.1 trypsin-like peptidase domain-containing protein [Klebsiella pneumoniae]
MIGPGYVVVVGAVNAGSIQFLGTGFFISNNQIITSRHVINGFSSNLVISVSDINEFNSYQDTSVNMYQYIPADIVDEDPVKDLCVLKLKDVSFSGPNLKLSSFDNIGVGESVGILGYPHCSEGRKILTFQTAMIGAKVLLASSNVKSKHAVINIQTRPGQSGSIVFNLKDNSVIGVLVGAYANNSGGSILIGGVNPAELHQTTYAVSAEYVKDML